MTDDLKGMKVAILSTDGVERVELEQPRGALYGAGASSDLLSIHSGEIQARQFDLISAGTFPVDHLVTDVSVEDSGTRQSRCEAMTCGLAAVAGASGGFQGGGRARAKRWRFLH